MRDTYAVAVVGAGIAGVTAAAAIARLGHRVLLVAGQPRHPAEFRAEKFGSAEAALFERLGLWGVAHQAMTCFDEVLVGEWGSLRGCVPMREYSMHYPALVDTLRAALPDTVETAFGRVTSVRSSGARQAITLADGRSAEAQLVVVATGLMDGLRREIGIGKTVLSPNHALVFGFDVADLPGRGPAQSITWRGESPRDGIAYLTLFPLGGALRANLFTYWQPSGADARAMAQEPAAVLASRFPGLARHVGPVVPLGSLEQRPISLTRAQGCERDGIVLIGDAFSTSCPTTGTGIRKVLTDVDRLVAHLPRWLAAPAIDTALIAGFYADPEKVARDRDSLDQSLSGRRLVMDWSPAWRLRRLRSYLRHRGRHALTRLRPGSGARRLAEPGRR